MEHFFPKQKLAIESFKDFDTQYELVRQSTFTNMDVAENCIAKCQVDLRKSGIQQAEKACLSKCFLKFLDVSLFIEKEVTQYTQQVNY